MSTSLEEMQQRMTKSTGVASTTKTPPVSKSSAGAGTSLAEMQKRIAPPPTGVLGIAAGAIKDTAVAALKPYIENYKQAAADHLATLASDNENSKKSPDLFNALKALNDVITTSFVLPASVIDTGITQPIKAGIAKLGDMLAQHAAPDDERTPQQKREGVPAVKPKVDWKVRQADVKQTVESINSGLDAYVNSLEMVAGGKAGGPETGVKEPLLDLTERTIRSNRRDAGLNPVSGKPHLTAKPMTMEQVQAGMRDATHELIEPMADGGGLKKAVRPNILPSELVRSQLDMAVEPVAERIVTEAGGRTTGGDILTHLSTAADSIKGSEAYKAVIEGLKKNVADVPVNFVREFPDHIRSEGGNKVNGYYDVQNHSVHISLDGSKGDLSHLIIHELEHAATAKFVRDNPNAPLVKRLSSVVQEVKKRALRMGELHRSEDAQTTVPRLRHYGLTNEREFLSELKSNPEFIDFIVRSEAHASPSWKSIKIFNYLADLFRKMLRIDDPRATPILHESLFLGQEIARKQAGGGPITALRQMSSDAMMGAQEFSIASIDKAEKKLNGWMQDVLKVMNPEALGPQAKAAGAVVAKAIADRVRSTTAFTRNSQVRRLWWEQRKNQSRDFYRRYESGDKFANDPELAKIADRYRQWNAMIFMQDLDHGILYDPEENYLFHTFDNSNEFRQWADQTFGKKWGDPGFMKDRQFSMYEQAINANFKPRFDNPEDLMLARQHASDIAMSKVQALEELQRFGLAVKKPPGVKADQFRPKFPAVFRRSPNGDNFYVHEQAGQILFNAFDSKSLWADKSLGGSTFRGMMAVKNSIVPLRLGFSLFHALHVLHIANADMTALSLKGALTGTQGVVKTGVDFVKGVLLLPNAWQNARIGAGIVDAWKGLVPEAELTEADRQNLTYMSEGGFVPIMDHHWNTGAIAQFKKGIAQAKGGAASGGVKAVWHAPWALMEGLQAPLFQAWIPNLKAASYLKNVAGALKSDPSLYDNPLKRRQAFRRIAQSVDNRYGEMNYETLLWKKWAKDLAVLNTLSLGWQLGFLREYGGGGLDLGQFAVRGERMQSIKEGKLDRALFASTYTATALGYGGLLTWAMTGQPPQELTDYILPRTGELNSDGSPARVNTMFYTREFQSIYKHVQAKGLGKGLTELAESKASGVVGLFAELYRGVNSFGQQIRDPGDPAYKRLEESLAYAMTDMEPIAFKSMQGDLPSKARAVLGFTPAPAFMTDSKTVGQIKDNYQRFVAPQEKPYDRLARSAAFARMRTDFANGKPVGEELDKLSDEFNLSSQEQRRMVKDLNSNQPPATWMFQRLPWESQKVLLDGMSDEERNAYLPFSNKQHLRGRYETPGS